MKLLNRFGLCVLLALGTLGINGELGAVQSDGQAAETKSADKTVLETFREIATQLEHHEIRSAADMMTEDAADEFSAEVLANSLFIQDFADEAEEIDGAKLRKLLETYKLDSVELPAILEDPEAMWTDEGEAALDQFNASLLEVAEANGGRWEAVGELHRVISSEMFSFHPFSGEPTVDESTENRVTVRVDFDSDEFLMPSQFLTFDRVESGWKWSGYDQEKTAAAEMAFMEEFDLMMEESELGTIEDPEFSGVTSTGKQVSLADYRGKLVLVDFWGTWCGPCVAELPSLRKIHAAFQEHGFEVVGVAYDEADELTDFEEANGKLPWHNLIDGEGVISEKFGIQAFPTTLLVDEDGNHIATDLFGGELIEAIVEHLELDRTEFEDILDEAPNETSSTSAAFDANGIPADPGTQFVPLTSLDQTIDDAAIFAAVYHRYIEHLRQTASDTIAIELENVPNVSATIATADLPLAAANQNDTPPLERLFDASVIIAGGGEEEFFTAGGVLISDDGLALTNFHVAEAMADSLLVGMTTDGRCHRIVELVAGAAETDVALVRLEGEHYTSAELAADAPLPGQDLLMIHLSENRFYTYDRGYVMRYSRIGGVARLEVSAAYAPGGSGCGIFNEQHQLVGLVSSISMGDGPSLAQAYDDESYEAEGFDEWENDAWDSEGAFDMFGSLIVKHAVPLSAIQSLFASNDDATNVRATNVNGTPGQ